MKPEIIHDPTADEVRLARENVRHWGYRIWSLPWVEADLGFLREALAAYDLAVDRAARAAKELEEQQR